ncbi:hypothetical protein FRC08_008235 [Ceratobasidium sp. 394]|nr:hypothetical protein FRC08_008235 [Ceratobasidium sp. 394]
MSTSRNKPLPPISATNNGASASSIPVIRSSEPSHRLLLDRFQEIFASAGVVTIVCGAGILTHAGIPDFRSKGGLLRQTFGERGELKGSELFESRTLADSEKRKAYSKALTRMRVMARDAEVTSCHVLITKLFDDGCLSRCYTQNIDGLQTRDRGDMEHAVVELHGTNAHLKCSTCKMRPTQPARDFDQRILSDGYVLCPLCLADPTRQTGSRMKLRCSKPGELLPDILLNDESKDVWATGETLDKMVLRDARCDLMIVVGTRLKSQGAAQVVKALAAKVHVHGGTVVYVDWKSLAPSVWAHHIDLHLETNIEEWAKDCIVALNANGKKSSKQETAAQFSMLLEEVRRTTDTKRISTERRERGAETERPRKQVKFTPEPPQPPVEPSVPTLFVVCYDTCASFHGRVLADKLSKACVLHGWVCHEHLVETDEEVAAIALTPGWNAFRLVVIHISWSAQRPHGEAPLDPEKRDIIERLQWSSRIVSNLAEAAVWSTLVMVCPEQELLSDACLGTIEHEAT